MGAEREGSKCFNDSAKWPLWALAGRDQNKAYTLRKLRAWLT
jgi:hypothetical protein